LTANRLQKLRSLILENGLDAIIISQPENRCYLSRFTGSSGWLFISDEDLILATDFRYTEQAKQETEDFEVVETKGEIHKWFPELVSHFKWQKLGFEATHISYANYQKLDEVIKSGHVNFELAPTTGLVEGLRSVKETQELEFIAKAVELTEAAFRQVKAIIHPGIRENELAWEIEKFLRNNGSEGIPFEIIVASGPNSASPHGRPTERIICSGEPVLIDMGARVSGYCSDFSRTLCLAEADKTFREIYSIVLEAQFAAIEGVKTGMDAIEGDRLARVIIEKAGYSEAFGHGLGHGVGLVVHESPALSQYSSDSLLDGMVFTLEPGIYLPGWGGVRIEDMVALKEGKPEVLTKSERALPCVS